MDIQTLTREFRYNGVVLPDPGQALSLTQVRDFYANVYPEITSADIEGPQQTGGKQIYTFRRAVGTKGATSPRDRALQQLRAGGRLNEAARLANIITAEQARQPLGQQLRQLIDQHRRAAGPRCLAPSVNHSVLP
jgi:PRTRC genetic system protein C